MLYSLTDIWIYVYIWPPVHFCIYSNILLFSSVPSFWFCFFFPLYFCHLPLFLLCLSLFLFFTLLPPPIVSPLPITLPFLYTSTTSHCFSSAYHSSFSLHFYHLPLFLLCLSLFLFFILLPPPIVSPLPITLPFLYFYHLPLFLLCLSLFLFFTLLPPPIFFLHLSLFLVFFLPHHIVTLI